MRRAQVEIPDGKSFVDDAVQLQISAMKATQLRNLSRNTSVSIATQDKAWLVTGNLAVVKKEGFNPHLNIEDELLLWYKILPPRGALGKYSLKC